MSEHTPGPWHYGGIARIYAYHEGPHKFLHSRVVSLVPAAELENGEDERRANARLIAAAPELLAALKDLYGVAVGSETILPRALLEAAAAAISKAEGKS